MEVSLGEFLESITLDTTVEEIENAHLPMLHVPSRDVPRYVQLMRSGRISKSDLFCTLFGTDNGGRRVTLSEGEPPWWQRFLHRSLPVQPKQEYPGVYGMQLSDETQVQGFARTEISKYIEMLIYKQGDDLDDALQVIAARISAYPLASGCCGDFFSMDDRQRIVRETYAHSIGK